MQLGQRLKFQASLANVESNGFEELRKEATLVYVAAGRLEKVVNIWIIEMTKENHLPVGKDGRSSLQHSRHMRMRRTHSISLY